MLIPVLHFDADCEDAIALYEKAFNTKAEHYDYGDDGKVRHAEIVIHGQTVYLNDAKCFIRNTFGVGYTTHLALTFNTSDELLVCYEALKQDDTASSPFVETPYSKLVGNFVDKVGILWGFMVIG